MPPSSPDQIDNTASHDVEQYRPLLLSGDAEELVELRAMAIVHDTFLQQLDGLIASRHPQRRLSSDELRQKRAEYLAGRTPERVGVWVYYPWRRALVHLLDELDFVELRTSRNRHKISRDEQQELSRKRVGIIGLSVGAQVAIVLAMERTCGVLRLADFDVLELSNLNRLREGVLSLGLSKSVLAARNIAELDPFLKVRCYSRGVTPDTLDAFLTEGGRLDVLVDECDDVVVKLRCRERARAWGIPVVMEANDRATLDIERFDREPERPILHGWLEGLDLSRVEQLKTSEDKVPYLLPMVGQDTMSDALRASLLEVGESIETWPQLASDVSLGAGVVAHVVRRISIGQLTASGRYFVDLEEIVRDDAPEQARGAETPTSGPDAEVAPPWPVDAIARLSSDAEPGQLTLERQSLLRLIEAAARAPSGANEQPWCWHVRGPNLWLLGRPRFGTEQLLNYEQSAVQLALGTAAENLVLCAHREGYATKLVTARAEDLGLVVGLRCFPRQDDPEISEPHAWDHLCSQLFERHTNRRRGSTAALPGACFDALESAGSSVAGCRVKLLAAPEMLAEVADIAARAERIRLLHPQGHRDLLREVRWTPGEADSTRDGIDLRTFELSPSERVGLSMLRSPGVPKLLRRWREGRGLEKLTRAAVTSASAVGLIAVSGGDALEWFRGGRAVQRVWLSASELGVALQPHTAALYLCHRARSGGASVFDAETLRELSELRERLCRSFELDEREHQVFLFRLFPGCEPPARSLRRNAHITWADEPSDVH